MTTSEDTLKRLAEHEGEMLLVATRHWAFNGCIGMGRGEPRPEDQSLNVRFELGIIAEPFVEGSSGGWMGSTFFVRATQPWSIVPHGKEWKQREGRHIVLIHHTLKQQGQPIYAPDAQRASSQRRKEEEGSRDPDYALEVIIGNAEVEEWLCARIYSSLDQEERVRPMSSEEFPEIERQRARRIFPQGVLDWVLDFFGIADIRRQATAELLQDRQNVLRELLFLELEDRFDLVRSEKCALRWARMVELAALAKEISADTIEPFVASDINGIQILIGDPSAFLEAVVKGERVDDLVPSSGGE